jgi:tellurite resistance protein TerC
MLFSAKQAINLKDNWLLQNLQKYLPLTNYLHNADFYVKSFNKNSGKNKIYFTPLLLALVLIEFLDLIFAIDSIPAIFTISTNPFVVYTSNIFAIVGLRALYFSIDALTNKFKYLHYSLALILIFIGAKIFIPHINIIMSLSVTLSLIAGGIILSITKQNK